MSFCANAALKCFIKCLREDFAAIGEKHCQEEYDDVALVEA
jgi:hypothetical protein